MFSSGSPIPDFQVIYDAFKRLGISILIIFFSWLIVFIPVKILGLTYVSSDSINPTFLIDDAGELQKDKYITFNVLPYVEHLPDIDNNKLSKLTVNADKQLLVSKRIACIPGDTITTRHLATEKRWYCNNSHIATRLMHQHTEQLIASELVIPADKVFVLGDQEDSFDSRYFNLIDLTQPFKLQIPLF